MEQKTFKVQKKKSTHFSAYIDLVMANAIFFMRKGDDFMARKKVSEHTVNGVVFEEIINYRLKSPLKDMGGNRYWQAILYLDHIVDDWKEKISSICTLPFECILHDKDNNKDGTHRKDHIHIIVAWTNTTKPLSAFKVFSKIGIALSKDGQSVFAPNTMEAIDKIGNAHRYMTHNTDDAQKKGKHLYDDDELISGNSFDIGMYEQLDKGEESEIKSAIEALILEKRIKNYLKLKLICRQLNDSRYIKVLEKNVYEFSTLTRSMWQWEQEYINQYGRDQYQEELQKDLDSLLGTVDEDE